MAQDTKYGGLICGSIGFGFATRLCIATKYVVELQRRLTFCNVLVAKLFCED